ncbi:hypothetical protein MLD38_037529 [Melastoma candidum]|uniref:Uncharacterized protein n=1 Tax=Melastoma candidum TaxID=119954 RepID=A0ACB9LN09_9MYRT|nr:hypothetical protein MLD38_037529 [Melastoma candidum]
MVTVHHSQDGGFFDVCAPFVCGGINFSFPFSNLSMTGLPLICGIQGYQITCDPSDVPHLMVGRSLYRVESLNPFQRIITLVNTQLIEDLSSGSCDYLQESLVLPPLSPASGIGYNLSRPGWSIELSFYFCNPNGARDLPRDFLNSQVINYACSVDCCEKRMVYLDRNTIQTSRERELGYGNSTPNQVFECQLVNVPGSDNLGLADSLLQINGTDQRRSNLRDGLNNRGFSLTWPSIPECDICQQMNGRCGYDITIDSITCFYQGGPLNNNVPEKKTTSRKRIIIIGAASGSSLLVTMAALLLLWKKILHVQGDNTRYNGPDAEELIRTCRSTLLINYSFKDVKKMTVNFKHKVGEGGYGKVYRGRLTDGRVVAVKMLDKLNNESQDFVNEVGTIGRIHHLNIIRLLGFCYEGVKRALVYEYMPNRSLGYYLREGGCVSLSVNRLEEIALGIARGIQYLHMGCESRILHLDIKPHNVLLDEEFIPKISDFGLAKMHSRQKSAISMSGARGTVGFIAPELFLRNFGNPSHKSDVYSFGMLLIDMVGLRMHKVNTNAPSSESYFPTWIYDKVTEDQKHNELGDSATAITRKLSMIALWCIQMNPRDRPSMTEVLEMLSGSARSHPNATEACPIFSTKTGIYS